MRAGGVFLALLLLLSAVVLACDGEGPAQTAPPLADSAIANATYAVEFAPGGSATLVNGAFSAPGPGGGATGGVNVSLVDTRGSGDLDGDGDEDAAAVLTAQTGGTGTFYQLYAVLNDAGAARPAASTFLGDRVVLHSVDIEDGRITVKMRVAGPGDAACCPATEAVHVYAFEGGQLRVVSKTP